MAQPTPIRPDLGQALDFDHRAALSRLGRSPRQAPRRPADGRPSAAEAPAEADPSPAPPPVPGPPDPAPEPSAGPGLDTRGHLLRPAGHGPVEALEPRLAAAFGLIRDEAMMAARTPAWKPVLTVACPTCGEQVGFASTPVDGGFSHRARSPCPSPGGLPAYAAPLLVTSGAIAVAADLTALSRLESSSGHSDLAERALDEARAIAGIVTVRLPRPGATLRRREGLLLVGYPDGADGAGGDASRKDEAIRLPATVRGMLCLMDHDLFLERCGREGFDPDRFRAVRVAMPSGSYGALHRPPSGDGGGAVVALLAPAAKPVDAPRDAAYGDDVASGQALALLRGLAARVGDPYGALVHALCYPSGELAWSRGALRRAPRPADGPSPTPPRRGPDRPSAETLAPWRSIAPPPAGSPEDRAAGIAARMNWHLPPLSTRPATPLQSIPSEIHPHWLAAAILLARTACGRPDLLSGRTGKDRARQVRLLRGILADLLDRAAAHPEPEAVEAALAGWRSLDRDAWR